MKVLALSSSTPHGSVALVDAGHVVSARSFESHNTHAELIFACIDAVMAEGVLQPSALAAVACDVGPGSFTGVRVALATVLGMADALSIPALGVGSLQAMAHAAFAHDPELERVACMIDARKEEAFVAAYDRSLTEVGAAAHLGREASVAWVGEQPVVGAFAASWGLAALRAPFSEVPHARSVALLAAEQLAQGRTAPAEARYVRPPDAKTLLEQAALRARLRAT